MGRAARGVFFRKREEGQPPKIAGPIGSQGAIDALDDGVRHQVVRMPADAMDGISRQVGPGRVLNGPSRKKSPNVDVPAALAKGLGFSKGRGYSTAFTEWLERNEKTLIGGLVAKWMGNTGESLSAAADEIAHRLEISNSTAERAYRSLGPIGRKLRDEAASAARRR